jgi:RNA polymerase sigma-70 factor (ECF subfamily)
LEPTDVELLDRWRAGDSGAGSALFRRHFDSVYGFFETKCSDAADELTQTTFLACVRSRDTFRKQASFRTFLFTIARHELYRMLRSKYRKDVRLDFEHSSIAEIVTTPRSRIARDQEHARLTEVLQELPVDTQTLLELHYRQELDFDQLAEIYEVTNHVIRMRLSRARKDLRERLEKRARSEALEISTKDDWAARMTRS